MPSPLSLAVTLERNRRAAAAAAAQIAEEAEHQRRQRPSSRHLLERQVRTPLSPIIVAWKDWIIL